MAFTLSDLRENTKGVTIYVANQPIRLKIRPAAVTQEAINEYRDASEEADYDRMAAIFADIVVEWDIIEEEGGEQLPINGATLATIPTMVTALIWDEVTKLVTPKSRKKSES